MGYLERHQSELDFRLSSVRIYYLVEETDSSSPTEDNVDTEDDEIIPKPPNAPKVSEKVKVGDAKHLGGLQGCFLSTIDK